MSGAATTGVPECVTGAQEALDRETAVLRPFGVTSASRVHEPDDVDFGRAILLDDVPEEE